MDKKIYFAKLPVTIICFDPKFYHISKNILIYTDLTDILSYFKRNLINTGDMMNFPSIMHFHYVSSKSSIIIFHYMSTYIKHRNLKLVNKDLGGSNYKGGSSVM